MTRKTPAIEPTPESNPDEPTDPTEPIDQVDHVDLTDGSDTTDGDTSRRPSFVRRHPIGTGIAAAAVAVVLVSGLTAWGVGAAVTASLTSSTSASSALGSMNATGAGRVMFRGTIASISGSTWTITTRNGRTVEVAISAETQFGTKKAPAAETDFAEGDSVIVIGSRDSASATHGTALRIVAAKELVRHSDSTTP